MFASAPLSVYLSVFLSVCLLSLFLCFFRSPGHGLACVEVEDLSAHREVAAAGAPCVPVRLPLRRVEGMLVHVLNARDVHEPIAQH